MDYPTIELIEGRAILNVNIPRQNYKNLVSRFYRSGHQKDIEEYSEGLASLLNTEIRLLWNKQLGLKNISIGPSAGLDLEEERGRYVEHNIWTLEQAIPAFLVATKYISLLLCHE